MLYILPALRSYVDEVGGRPSVVADTLRVGEGGKDLNVWVVLPTYNEAENLPRMVAALNALGLGLRVLVVDDDSPDGTAAAAEQLARRWPDLHVVRRVGERGLGTAYVAGFRRALQSGADAVLTMDCDFSHDPRAVPSLLGALGSADVVIGSRYVAGGRISDWSLRRRVLSASANGFVRALFRMPARDCTSGFRLYRREVLESVPWESVRSTGYAFLVESLHWAARAQGVRVREVPVHFKDRELGETKMGMSEAFDGVRKLVRLRFDLRRGGLTSAGRARPAGRGRAPTR
jgi:dolichol-phosphate mannosyltransferase